MSSWLAEWIDEIPKARTRVIVAPTPDDGVEVLSNSWDTLAKVGVAHHDNNGRCWKSKGRSRKQYQRHHAN